MIMLKGRRIKMQISSRFTMAIHMFACIDTFTDQKMTSDFMAASIGTNPVIVRKLLQQLKAAGLIEVSRGTGGVTVTKPLNEITFLDIYKAVECTPDEELFHFHENPNQACPVGKNIHHVLDDKLAKVQEAMERELAAITLADVKRDIALDIEEQCNH
jgi:transcriptional regulator, badM/rrf2 family